MEVRRAGGGTSPGASGAICGLSCRFLRRLGQEGAHPPAPKAPLVGYLAVNGLQVALLAALSMRLGLEVTHLLAPRAPSVGYQPANGLRVALFAALSRRSGLRGNPQRPERHLWAI